jgi:hypothetical protein
VGGFAYINTQHGLPNALWHGLVVRGLRYMNWSDIRPFIIELGAKDLDCVWNGLSPVALFDHACDDLGPASLFRSWPTLNLLRNRSVDMPQGS